MIPLEIREEQPPTAPRNTKQLKVSTAVVHCKGQYAPSNEDRTKLLRKIINVSSDSDVILLPAGFYEVMEHEELFPTEKTVSDILKQVNTSAVVCVGTDFRDGIDQIAYAIGAQGTLATGRKFHPTKDEAGKIATATDFMAKENGQERIFQVNGFACYLAVCYDCFGIRHLKIKNPGVDIVFDLVHRFYQKGHGPSGDVDFARKGFAGTSMQWQCPVFGAAVFFEREIPPNWPTGVLWSGTGSVREFKYEDNQMTWAKKFRVVEKRESAVIYKYIVSG